MFRNRKRWVLYSILPLAFFLIPFTTGLDFFHAFHTLTLEPHKTGITTLNYFDQSRNRPLVTEVWYPVDSSSPSCAPTGFWVRCDEARDVPISTKKSQYPLVVMSHGSNGDRYNTSWLAEALAANGYIVVAMDHYGNTWNNKIPECHATPWERPLDITFVLDQILEESSFKERIDLNNIGFAGYSLGGATGMWIAGAQITQVDFDLVRIQLPEDVQQVPKEVINTIDFSKAQYSYKDPRFTAAVMMAPALGWAFSEASLEQIDIPVFIIAPEQDSVVPTEQNAKIFAQKIKKATLSLLPGEATHYVFLNRVNRLGKRFLSQKYCEDPSSINRAQIHRDLAKQSIHFFDKHLK